MAADANATAVDVLERLRDLNLRLSGIKTNYSELEKTVEEANQMIQDPEKNSEVLFLWLDMWFQSQVNKTIKYYQLKK